MNSFLVFSLVVFGLCELSSAASKHDLTWTNSFTFPYKRPVPKGPPLGIVGGDQASPHQFPYQVGMFVDTQFERFFCGGSLISVNYVLTAAHCVQGAVSIDLIFGAHNISNDAESNRQRQTSTSYVVHPNWDQDSITNDLAIIKLAKPVTLNQYLQVIKLTDGSDTYAGRQGTTIGWGLTADSQRDITSILRYTSNNILSKAQCKAIGPDYDAFIQDVHLCLSGEGNKEVCDGDSGGPLVSDGIQVGVTSFGYKSCEASMPSVFVRLTLYTEWIKANSDVHFEKQ